MKLTAEQEFLKAIALSVTADYINLPMSDVKKYLASLEHEQRMNASCPDCNDSGMYKGYDISCECQKEKGDIIKEKWTPEVGKLCRNEDGIYEITVHASAYRLKDILDDSFYDQPMTFDALAREYTPIAELEGLKVGDSVYGIAYQKYTHLWHITGITGSLIFVKKHGESAILTLNKHGFSYEIGSTQLFWRTADRAERFGRGDA